MSEDELIDVASRALVDRALAEAGPYDWVHFCFLDDLRDPPDTVFFHWQKKNMFGVSYSKRRAGMGRLWAKDVIRAGYTPARATNRKGIFTTPAEVSEAIRQLRELRAPNLEPPPPVGPKWTAPNLDEIGRATPFCGGAMWS